MERLNWIGLALIAVAGMSWLASELVGPAYASRDADKVYAVAISAGSGMELRREGSASGTSERRILLCRDVYGLAGINLGFDCRAG